MIFSPAANFGNNPLYTIQTFLHRNMAPKSLRVPQKTIKNGAWYLKEYEIILSRWVPLRNYVPDSKEGVACATFEFVLFKGLKSMSSSASSSSSASERWKSSSVLLSLVVTSSTLSWIFFKSFFCCSDSLPALVVSSSALSPKNQKLIKNNF